MRQISFFVCVLLVLLCSNTNAQNLTLKDGLSRIPFSKMPYKERNLPIGYTDGCIVNIYDGIDANMYEDLQCTEFDSAKKYVDFTPEVYLKIALPNSLYLGALSFGGCTEYRTDVLFVSDTNGNVKDTLECCVLNGELAVKQYEVKSTEEIIIYQMIFEMPMSLKWTEYSGKAKALIGHIKKTTYRISSEGKFVKVNEQNTERKGITTYMLTTHNLWNPEDFNMSF